MTCEHCGATASGTLLGFPVIVHANDCPNAPPPLSSEDVYVLMGMPTKRWLCVCCGAQWDNPGEAQHALECPVNPLTN